MSMSHGYALVTFAYAPRQYGMALATEAMRWAGPDMDAAVEAWAWAALLLLTSPTAGVRITEDAVEVENGRGQAVGLTVAGSLT